MSRPHAGTTKYRQLRIAAPEYFQHYTVKVETVPCREHATIENKAMYRLLVMMKYDRASNELWIEAEPYGEARESGLAPFRRIDWLAPSLIEDCPDRKQILFHTYLKEIVVENFVERGFHVLTIQF